MTRLQELQAQYIEAGDLSKPHREATTELGVKQMRISHEIAIEIARQQYPDTKIETQDVLGVVTPSDAGASAMDAIRRMREAGVEPSKIIIQPNLMRVVFVH